MSLAGCLAQGWTPGIGDPTAAGWLLTAGYGGTAALSLAAWGGGRLRRFGRALALLLLALMVNKQLDLQSALTAAGKCLARAQGWYDSRHVVQTVFAAAVLAAALAGAALLARLAWRRPREIGPALGGLACLGLFVALRAAHIHHADTWPLLRAVDFAGIRWLEPLGLGLIAAQAAAALRLRRSRRGASKA